MQWFRLYDDVLDDPKVQQLSPVLFKFWINLLCLSNKSEIRGTLPSTEDIAFRLRISNTKAKNAIADLVCLGLMDRSENGVTPHNWDERQKKSDNVATRVAKHRSNVTETLHVTTVKQVGNVLDTDTDTDTERETDITPKPPKGGTPKKPRRTPPASAFTDVPEDLEQRIPAADWRKITTELGFSDVKIKRETRKMIDYYQGAGKKQVDWVAAWRKWMRSDFQKPEGTLNGEHPNAARIGKWVG